MKLGKIKLFLAISCLSFFSLNSAEKITTVPLVNLDDLEPSYELIENENEDDVENSNNTIKKKDNMENTNIDLNIMIIIPNHTFI